MNKFWKKVPVNEEMGRTGMDRTAYAAEGTIGKNYGCSNAHTLECCYHYNGSGKTQMNGSTDWPVVNLQVAFQEGQEIERSRFVAALQGFVADFFNPPVKEGIPLKDLPKWKAQQAALMGVIV